MIPAAFLVLFIWVNNPIELKIMIWQMRNISHPKWTTEAGAVSFRVRSVNREILVINGTKSERTRGRLRWINKKGEVWLWLALGWCRRRKKKEPMATYWEQQKQWNCSQTVTNVVPHLELGNGIPVLRLQWLGRNKAHTDCAGWWRKMTYRWKVNRGSNMSYYVFLLLMDDPFQLNHSELISFVNALNVSRICSIFKQYFSCSVWSFIQTCLLIKLPAMSIKLG